MPRGVRSTRLFFFGKENKKENGMEREMRRKERLVADVGRIYDILARCDTVCLGLNGDTEPYVIPMTFGLAMENGKIAVYFHSAKGGRKWEILNRDPRVCVEAHLYYKTVAGEKGVTALYESVIGTGVAEKIETKEEKVAAFRIMLARYKQSGFPASSCKGLPDAEVFRVVLNEVKGKHNIPEEGTL